jgi:hypothetical protein
MKPLYNKTQFDQAKGEENLPLSCYQCNNTFYVKKTYISSILKRKLNFSKYCSKNCQYKSKIKIINVKCGHCGNSISKKRSEIKKSKSNKVFCNHSCAAKHNNTHKLHGCRRSKIEIWIEEQLKILYPKLNIFFNNKTIINSELDIYIPSLSLAFELNGIFHYEPIYGNNKLKQIQCNDENKFFLCQQKKINLCIIDISSIVHFKPLRSQKFLDIICNIINDALK